MCYITKIFWEVKIMMIIKDIRIWSLCIFCGVLVVLVFFKRTIKEKEGEKEKKGIFFFR